MSFNFEKLSKDAKAAGIVRVLVILWSLIASVLAPPFYYLASSGLSVLGAMHDNLTAINLKFAGYEELRKQREQTLTHLAAKDEEHDKTLLDHEKRLSRLEGQSATSR